MTRITYKRVMESARRAAREGIAPELVAPPTGRLRDLFMQEYDKQVERQQPALEPTNDGTQRS